MDTESNGISQPDFYKASEIGRAVVEHYYDVLERFPNRARRFYAQKKGIIKLFTPTGPEFC